MAGKQPDWITINAYVDGELSAQEAAKVALAAESDRDVAEQIEVLYRMKGALRGAMPPAPEGLQEAVLDRPRSGARRPFWAFAVPFAAVLAVAGLVAPVLLRSSVPPAPATGAARAPDFLASARVLHQNWLSHDTSKALVPMTVVLDTLTRFGRLPLVPDLQDTGLEIGLARVVDGAATPIIEIGYRGHHGCHLSLFVTTGVLVPDLVSGRSAGERSTAWRVEDLTYLLLADGMDRGRFDLIAQTVEDASRRFSPLDAAERQKLAENHATAKACQV